MKGGEYEENVGSVRREGRAGKEGKDKETEGSVRKQELSREGRVGKEGKDKEKGGSVRKQGIIKRRGGRKEGRKE